MYFIYVLYRFIKLPWVIYTELGKQKAIPKPFCDNRKYGLWDKKDK